MQSHEIYKSQNAQKQNNKHAKHLDVELKLYSSCLWQYEHYMSKTTISKTLSIPIFQLDELSDCATDILISIWAKSSILL